MTTPVKRCRHNKSWLHGYATQRILWCYECGAIRIQGQWTKPVGPGGENPALKEKRCLKPGPRA